MENRHIGEGVSFERIHRITGYLVPDSRWNDAKKAELRDRVTHKINGTEKH